MSATASPSITVSVRQDGNTYTLTAVSGQHPQVREVFDGCGSRRHAWRFADMARLLVAAKVAELKVAA